MLRRFFLFREKITNKKKADIDDAEWYVQGFVLYFYEQSFFEIKTAYKANDASSCLMEWLHDGMIHDMLCLASSSFDLLKKFRVQRLKLSLDRLLL